jgi:hypothetical protein
LFLLIHSVEEGNPKTMSYIIITEGLAVTRRFFNIISCGRKKVDAGKWRLAMLCSHGGKLGIQQQERLGGEDGQNVQAP